MVPDPRLDLDSVLKCPECGGVPYRLFRRENRQKDGTPLGTWEHVLWPASPDVAPPRDSAKVCCPDCGCELRRAAP